MGFTSISPTDSYFMSFMALSIEYLLHYPLDDSRGFGHSYPMNVARSVVYVYKCIR